MIFNQDTWNQYIKGFSIYDCAVADKNRYFFLLVEDSDDQHRDPLPASRFIYTKIDASGQRVFGQSVSDFFEFATVAFSTLSNPEFISVDLRRHVLSQGAGSKFENDIVGDLQGTRLLSTIYKVVRVGVSIYALGSPFRVYQRIKDKGWLHHTENLPIPKGFIDETVEGLGKSCFHDLSGFSESDIYAVGDAGTVYHYDGKVWKLQTFPTNLPLYTVTCAGDGFVYISDLNGSIWKGRNERWERIVKADMSLPFFDSAWFDGRLWCASDYGMWVLEDGKMVLAMRAKHKPIPPEIAVVTGRIDVSPDNSVMLVCGAKGAGVYDGKEWKLLFNSLEFE